MMGSSPISLVGGFSSEVIRQIGAGTSLVAQALGALMRPPSVAPRLLLRQCAAIGVGSIPVVLITALFTGMVLALQSANAFARFGAENLIGTVVSLSMVRELGPVLTGVMVAGRSGSAMAAELANMRITEQIDALLTMATDPIRFLVLPRFLAAVIMMPCLVLFADLIGIVSGWIVAVRLLGNNPALYEHSALQYLTMGDLTLSLVKAAAFGAILAAVSCYHGFYVKGGAREVGVAVTRSVVISVIGILFFNYVLTAWLS
jgi:phospholipid/cholesterol/gamma-HCH transport system permease protein